MFLIVCCFTLVCLLTYVFLDWLLRSFQVKNFTWRIVFITGCDSGFGKALAIKLLGSCLGQDERHFPSAMVWTVLFLAVVLYFVLDWILRSFKVGNYTSKYVFISGCDSGFGKELALRLDTLGFNIFAGCLTEAGQKALAESGSSRMATFPLDVTSTESVSSALEFMKEKLGPQKGLWAVVNNAGIAGPIVPIEWYTKKEFAHTMDVNCLGHIDVCQQFLPLVRRSKGRFVNITSMYGRVANNPPAYSTSKFAFEAFSDCLRREVYDQGMKVCILEPGFFKTDIINQRKTEEIVRTTAKKTPDERKEVFGDDHVQKIALSMEAINDCASTDTWKVVDAFTHAVIARFPRTRYVVGYDAKLLMIPLSYLPAAFADWVLIRGQAWLTAATAAKRKQ